MEEKTYIPTSLELEANNYQVNLGDPSEKVIILTADRLQGLEHVLHELQTKNPQGIIITGNPGMFSAGADINVIGSCDDENEGAELARKGQKVFDLIASFNCPTIAAISGPCVGGACELSLSCDYRIISDNPKSVIGLPEVKIGILPGFGGTQRLPRIIGLPQALGVILQGKTLSAKKAARIGLVDEVTTDEKLLAKAKSYLAKPSRGLKFSSKVSLLDKIITKVPFARTYAVNQAKAGIKKNTKGFYPAPPLALSAVVYGLNNGVEEGLNNEAKLLGKLMASPECKALTNLFFLTENSKSIGKSAKGHIKDLNAMVIGAGTMGAGIAGVLSRSAYPVAMKDTKVESLERGINSVKKTLSFKKSLNDKQKQDIIDNIKGQTEYSEANKKVNFLIEAIFEDMDLKKKVLSEAATHIEDDAIIASNTSSLSITELATGLPVAANVVGMHFFNPVDRMPLVEIIRGKETSTEVICKVAALSTKLGKFPIVVEDVPGFLINRILVPYLNEAAFLLEEGYQIEDIDKAATSFGLPMGPVRLLDEIGLDVAKHVGDTLVAGYGKRMEAPTYPQQLVEQKRFGKKSKLGFYDYSEKPEKVDSTVYSLLNIKNKKADNHDHIQKRLIYSLVNEAVLCLDEGVAGAPGEDAAKQIDLGTIMGTGFPPFRGGLIYYANSVGAAKIVQEMQTLEREVGVRFRPVPGLFSRAEKDTSFYE